VCKRLQLLSQVETTGSVASASSAARLSRIVPRLAPQRTAGLAPLLAPPYIWPDVLGVTAVAVARAPADLTPVAPLAGPAARPTPGYHRHARVPPAGHPATSPSASARLRQVSGHGHMSGTARHVCQSHLLQHGRTVQRSDHRAAPNPAAATGDPGHSRRSKGRGCSAEGKKGAEALSLRFLGSELLVSCHLSPTVGGRDRGCWSFG
jgi:hypothetical protein